MKELAMNRLQTLKKMGWLYGQRLVERVKMLSWSIWITILFYSFPTKKGEHI